MAEAKLAIAVDARQAVKGVDSFTDALSDVVDEMEKVAKEGDDTERALVANFRDIEQAASKSGKDSGRKLSAGLKEGTDEAKSEVASSGREAAASFAGGFDDVADFAQESIANALSGFGPLGAAAGVAIAAALGAALAGAADAQEKLEAARERAAELAQTLYENRGTLPIEDAINRVLELLPAERGAGNPFESMLNGLLDLGTNIDAVRTASRLAKVPVGDFVRGLSGSDIDATKRSLEAVKGALQDIADEVNSGTSNRPLIEVANDEAALKSLQTQLETTVSGAELANEALSAVGSSGLPGSAEYIAQVDAIGSAWQDAMVDASGYVTEAEGVTAFDWSQYLTDAESTLAAANDYKARILTVPPDIRTEAENIFKTQGAKGASAYLQAFEGASAGDKQRFVNAAKANGEAAGKAQGEAAVKEADAAAKAKASTLTPTQLPVRPGPVDWNAVTRNPPTVYIPGVIVKPGTRQPL